jgi:hypothetical protein
MYATNCDASTISTRTEQPHLRQTSSRISLVLTAAAPGTTAAADAGLTAHRRAAMWPHPGAFVVEGSRMRGKRRD